MADSKEVRVECTVNNIHTSRGKMVKGGALMLPADEAKFIKDTMKAMKKKDA